MSLVVQSVVMPARSKRLQAVTDTEETAVVPDSTTTSGVDRSEFSPGQDILLKHKDGRYYFGTVVQVDSVREQCLVKFGDNTDNWSCFKDLVKLSTPEQEDLLCVVCKKSAPKHKYEITVCYKCGRGYHQKCHHPEIPSTCQKEDSNWMCKRCVEQEPMKQRKSAEFKQVRKESLRKSNTIVDSTAVTTINSLPYDPDTLSWDTYHRVNLEQTYCYCGQKGEWYMQMLQCGRCRQWFHEKCISCLRYPLYCGDRFYVFVCALCNRGEEFVRRLEVTWVDVVHLLLFNLTAYNTKKYYDLDAVILPYVNDNWHALRLPPKIFSVPSGDRREHILSVLTNNRNRFKCGREIKKRTTIWGLRVSLPPPAPCVTLSSTGSITDEELRERWQGNRRLQFLPSSDMKGDVIPVDSQMLNVMMGTNYRDRHVNSDTDSPCPSPEMDHIENKPYNKLSFPRSTAVGCVKKSGAPFPKLNMKHKKRLLSLNVRKRDKLLRRQKRQKGKAEAGKRCTTRVNLDSKSNKKITLPLTPPSSVSAPPTPPTSGSSNVGPDLSTDYSEHSNSIVIKKDKLDELHTPCDTSGDETSSKSTLDLIIPPPKDFEGKNNPFLTFLRVTGADDQAKKRRSKDSITLPLPLTAIIPARPLKRQLSEKDICVGPNGEVKRRRLRRSRSGQLPNYGQTASKTAAVVPVRPDANDWSQRSPRTNLSQVIGTPTTAAISSCVDYALNGRRLRQRQDNKSAEKDSKKPPTPKPSPVKQEPDISMDELKSSVHSYFGAATRILDGERFTVRAKRYGPNGKLEYLMEWEGVGSGMT